MSLTVLQHIRGCASMAVADGRALDAKNFTAYADYVAFIEGEVARLSKETSNTGEKAEFFKHASAAIYLTGILKSKLGLDIDQTSTKDIERAVAALVTEVEAARKELVELERLRHDVGSLKTTNETLADELARLREDKARLDFLQARVTPGCYSEFGHYNSASNVAGSGHVYDVARPYYFGAVDHTLGATLRAAIDADRLARPPQSKETK